MKSVAQLSYEVGGVWHEVQVSGETSVVGRLKACDVFIDHDSVSRRHAQIERVDGQWVIRDLGSRNGTHVNRARVDVQRLFPGDSIQLGGVILSFQQPSSRLGISGHGLSTSIKSVDLGRHSSRIGLSDRVEGEELVTPSPEWVTPLIGRAAAELLSSHSLPETLETILELLFDTFPFDRACLVLFGDDPHEKALQLRRVRQEERIEESFVLPRTVVELVVENGQAILIPDCPKDPRVARSSSVIGQEVHSVLAAPIVSDGRTVGLIYLDSRGPESPFTETHLEALATIASLAGLAVEQNDRQVEREREKKERERILRYVSPQLVERLLEESRSQEMLAEDLEVSVLFLDFVGFSRLAENAVPKEIADLLNLRFDALTACLFDAGGMLDKFTGDGLMAVFGAPLAVSDHAARAVSAALSMQRRLQELDQGRDPNDFLQARIGINSGPVLAGDLGSKHRREYTVIGDTVNVASRFESEVASMGQVVIGPETHRAVCDTHDCRSLGEFRLKGRDAAIEAWEVIGER